MAERAAGPNKRGGKQASRPHFTHVGTVEAGPRGPILRDLAGLSWRLTFAEGTAPVELTGQIGVRGRVIDPDRIEVEYFEAVSGT